MKKLKYCFKPLFLPDCLWRVPPLFCDDLRRFGQRNPAGDLLPHFRTEDCVAVGSTPFLRIIINFFVIKAETVIKLKHKYFVLDFELHTLSFLSCSWIFFLDSVIGFNEGKMLKIKIIDLKTHNSKNIIFTEYPMLCGC